MAAHYNTLCALRFLRHLSHFQVKKLIHTTMWSNHACRSAHFVEPLKIVAFVRLRGPTATIPPSRGARLLSRVSKSGLPGFGRKLRENNESKQASLGDQGMPA
jgi:hypothetical protein